MPTRIIGYYGDWHVIEDDERREHVAYRERSDWSISCGRVRLTFPGDFGWFLYLPRADMLGLFQIVEIFGTKFKKDTYEWPSSFATPKPEPTLLGASLTRGTARVYTSPVLTPLVQPHSRLLTAGHITSATRATVSWK